jgi:hypothetical protein
VRTSFVLAKKECRGATHANSVYTVNYMSFMSCSSFKFFHFNICI